MKIPKRLASCLLAFLMAAPVFAGDWPQLQHDAGHSGYIPETYGPPYKVLWWVDKNSPAPPVSVRVQPIIAYNAVYIPSDDGSVHTYNAATGAAGWTYSTGAPLVASVAVSTQTSTVYVGSTNGIFYALNAVGGGVKGSYQTSGKIRIAPVIAEGKVFIANTDGAVYGFPDGGSLQPIWTQSVGTAVLDTPAYDSGTLYVGTLASKAFALNGADGSVRWQKQLNGQGFRDRWITAGNGRVFFNPAPYYGGTLTQGDATSLLTPIYSSSWSSQRQSILSHFVSQPFYQASYIFDAQGNETDPPILYTSGGSTSEHPQPVVLPNGNFNTLYRYTEGINNPGCGATCICWSIYLGDYNPSTNDIMNLDTWGTGSSWDMTKKTFNHTDESTALMRSGNIVYLGASRGVYGFDTVSKTIIQYVTFDPGVGGIFGPTVPVNFYNIASPSRLPNGWIAPYPGAEIDSDGNDYVRPVAIANGVFYFLHDSTLMAVSGTLK